MKRPENILPFSVRTTLVCIALLGSMMSVPFSPAQAETYKRGVTLQCTLKTTHNKGAIPKEIVVGVTGYDSVVVSDEMTRNQGGPVEGEILSNRADTLVARWDLVAAKPGGTTVMNRPVYRFVVYKKDLTATLEATGQTMNGGINSRPHLGRGTCKRLKDPRVLAKLQQDARATGARKQKRSSDNGCRKQPVRSMPTQSHVGGDNGFVCP